MAQTSTKLSFDSLVQEVAACRACQHELPLGPRPVFRIQRSAKILVVGQAPGRRVHETGIPFNDPSGVRLREWMGIDEKTFYDDSQIAILPMAFCFPGSGKNGDLPPPPRCAALWRERLLDQLEGLELTLLVGRYAVDWHLKIRSNTPLKDIVAEWREYLPEQVPLPHPSPRNNRWLKNNPWFEQCCVPAIQRRVRETIRR